MSAMAPEVRWLDLKIGDVVEIDRRATTSCPNKAAGVALELAITERVEELPAAHGGGSLTPEECDELFGDLPGDGRSLTP